MSVQDNQKYIRSIKLCETSQAVRTLLPYLRLIHGFINISINQYMLSTDRTRCNKDILSQIQILT